MQQVSCPGCGAPVQFQSHAAVMAVCSYCKTTLVKDGESVKDLGRMSDVLTDYSPFQIGTSGQYRSRAFTIIGRIQLRYPAGIWNEWYVLFDNGRTAWLSEASGQYAILVESTPKKYEFQRFGLLRPGQSVNLQGESYTVADVRIAECTAGQGELPFKVGPGWKAFVADLRTGKRMATLDYSDGDSPAFYVGDAVTLTELQCQFLREDEIVRDAAGKLKTEVESLSCPSCGSGIGFVPGVTQHLVCPSCRTHLDASTSVATAIEAGQRFDDQEFTLELGATANISGSAYQLIGVMVRRNESEDEEWTEYLAYSPRKPFLWLIETADGWYRAHALDEWPQSDLDRTATLRNNTYTKKYDYDATVAFVAGAFNWRVQAGDTVRVKEFAYGRNSLSAEFTSEELTWSFSSPVSADQMRAWFGSAFKTQRSSGRVTWMGLRESTEPESIGPKKIAEYFTYGLLIFNFVPILEDNPSAWLYTLFALAAIHLPAHLLDKNDDDGDSE